MSEICVFGFTGHKIERSLSAKRKESADTFIPVKPVLVKSKTLDGWDGQSKLHILIFKCKNLIFFAVVHKNSSEKKCVSHQGPRSQLERSLSATRKASVEERDSEETRYMVCQAIQKENASLQNAELFSRNMVRLTP